jgi:hypothetical protein
MMRDTRRPQLAKLSLECLIAMLPESELLLPVLGSAGFAPPGAASHSGCHDVPNGLSAQYKALF